ncbi:CAP domain-containing protein [Ureibacillus sp. FSL K6-8385]|nr:CAP domain-containing protein [Ureibacillus terrenus]MED3764544.1 CAP domain-containing protein [Ureibacillus terrenus]
MKKWFITVCALFLFAVAVPQAGSASSMEEPSGKALQPIEKIVLKWEHGILAKKSQEPTLPGTAILKQLTLAIEQAKNQLESIISRSLIAQQEKEWDNPREERKVQQPTSKSQKIAGKPKQQEVPVSDGGTESTFNKQKATGNRSEQTDDYLESRQTNEAKHAAPSAPILQAEAPQAKEETSTGLQVSEFERQVVELTNAERAKAGLKPLEMYSPLMAAAKVKSQDMANLGYFSHTSPTYGSPFDQMRAAGIQFRAAGENIAQGQRTPEQVVNAWMNSPGHRANILNPNYTHIGVGFAENGYYWTQQFIQK